MPPVPRQPESSTSNTARIIIQSQQSRYSRSSHRGHARLQLIVIYGAWFYCLALGMLFFKEKHDSSKGKDLPLHFFDTFFRKFGAALIFFFWTIRAAFSHILAFPRDHLHFNLWIPGALYVAQAGLRSGLYYLHYQGHLAVLQLEHWLGMDQQQAGGGKHSHVMSDHILLAASVVAGCACEAMLTMLSLSYTEKHRGGQALMWVYAVAAACAGLLVSAGSFFTSRYFHPPAEIIVGAVLGLIIFQAPLLLFVSKEVRKHRESGHTGAAAGDGDKKER